MDPMNMFPAAGEAGVGGEGEAAAAADDGKLIELCSTQLEKSACYARNESSSYPMTNLFLGDDRLGCRSDADEQLILHLAFIDFVKIQSIHLMPYNCGLEPEANPTKVHLYVNRKNMGFEDAEDVDPTQTLELSATDLQAPIPLKFVKFQRVKSLTLFIEDNAGGDYSALGGLQLWGRMVSTTNMKEFKKQQT